MWIGGIRNSGSRYWQWSARFYQKRITSYTGWQSGRPSLPTSQSACMQIAARTGYWFDTSCSNRAGFICEIDMNNACLSSPCKNGGRCKIDGTGYTCQCPSNYNGVNCERVNPCYPSPCRNGGTCLVSGIGYLCRCTSKYKGNNCEQSKRLLLLAIVSKPVLDIQTSMKFRLVACV